MTATTTATTTIRVQPGAAIRDASGKRLKVTEPFVARVLQQEGRHVVARSTAGLVFSVELPPPAPARPAAALPPPTPTPIDWDGVERAVRIGATGVHAICRLLDVVQRRSEPAPAATRRRQKRRRRK